MDSGVLFQQLLVLMALMLTGFIAYKTKLIDDGTYSHLSSLMVWVLNPFLMISGVIGKDAKMPSKMIFENLAMVGILYISLFVVSFLYCFVLRYKGQKNYFYRLLMLFPNVGFMGIPIVRVMLGNQYVVLVAFYLLVFNLISYSYGIYLSSRAGGKTEKFNPKKLLSPGMIGSLLAIIIFAFHVEPPTPVVTYIDYLGNACITFSMIIIGVFMARLDFKTAFADKSYYIFTIAKMVIIPIIYIYLTGFLPFDPVVKRVAQVEICMPVATMTCMFTQEYAGDGTEAAKVVTLTTILTVISAPFVVWLVG